jgi:hypothetical protein
MKANSQIKSNDDGQKNGLLQQPVFHSEARGLDEALTYLRQGDVLVVWRLDRLDRSLKRLIESVNSLEKQGIGLQSLQASGVRAGLGREGTVSGAAHVVDAQPPGLLPIGQSMTTGMDRKRG